MKTKSTSIICFEAMDDPSITWLDKCGQIGCKELEMDVFHLVGYIMTREIVN